MTSSDTSAESSNIFQAQRDYRMRIEAAFDFHQKNQLDEAEKIYRDVLQEVGEEASILGLLGTLLLQKGNLPEAEKYLLRANEITPDDNEILNNLGGVYRNEKKWDKAAEIFAKSIALNRYNWQSQGNMAKTQFELEQYESGLSHAENALELNPSAQEMHKVIADCARHLRQFEKAEMHYRAYLEKFSDDAEAMNNLAFTLENNKNWEEARELYGKAFELRPDEYEIGLNYGNILMFFKEYQKASEAYRKALEIKPKHIPTYIQLIQSLLYQFQLDRAYLYAKTMVTLPEYDKVKLRSLVDRVSEYVFDFDEQLDNSGNIFENFNDMQIQFYAGMFMNCFKYCKDEATTLQLSELAKKHGDYQAEVAKNMECKKSVTPVPRKYPRIRLGILSSDLRAHVVTKFSLPLLMNYNKDVFEIRCYNPLKKMEDDIQKLIRNNVEEFNNVENLYNNELADKIMSDDNDILIDMNGYTADTRVNLMAKKLAPVQMEWIGYPFTTGISAIDYMIFDRFNMPELPGYGTEEPLIMPNSYACYTMGGEPEFDVAPPLEKNGHITFGTFNNPNKYTPTIIETWAKCMHAVPGSKFLFIRPETKSEFLRTNVQNEFAKHGIDPDRIDFFPNKMGHHLGLYRNLDISLDVFPLTGGTTTCESMSMGVPVVTRYGSFHHSRLSRSFISNAGFPELCAASEDEFVNIVANLSADTNLLRWLHANLRSIMYASPLCDTKLFCSDFEIAMQTVVEKHGLR